MARIAADRHGIVSRDDARSAGLSERQILTRVRLGRWEQVHPGVYRIAGAPGGDLADLAAATVWTTGVASHLSAAWLLGLVDPVPQRPEVTAGRSRTSRRAGVRVHRTADLIGSDTTTCHGIRCTTATRTCIDLGARLGVAGLERVIDRALHLRLTHLDRLILRFLQLARPGRDGIAAVRQVLTVMDPALAPAESDLETLLLQILRDHGVRLPVRQYVLEVEGRTIRVDLCYPEHRLVIESDGFTHHGGRLAFEGDRERQNLLVLAGWRVLRFTWRHICDRPAWVAQQVRRALEG